MRYPAEGDQWRVVKTLAEGDGWRIVQTERWADPWCTVNEVALIPGPFVSSRELRNAISLLVEWRIRLRDQQGPVVGAYERADRPAMACLINVFLACRLSLSQTAREMNRHLSTMFEDSPDTVNEWLDELNVPKDDRSDPKAFLTRKAVESAIVRWCRSWEKWSVSDSL